MARISSYLVIALTLIAAAVLHGQTGIRQSASPAIEVYGEDGKPFFLKITNVTVNVSVAGGFAVTTMDLSFDNKENRVLEGELSFPLPEGSYVSRFAMDINGRLREGVIVEKDKGRETFESIVRRGVDPGLLELTAGNVFRARVYPILPGREKRIVLSYRESLNSDSLGLVYGLPLDFPDELSQFELKAIVHNELVKPQLKAEGFEGADFEKEGNSFAVRVSYRDYTARSRFEIHFPNRGDGTGIFIEDFGSKTYFLAALDPFNESIDKPLPSHISVFYDISSSAAGRDPEKEMELLDSYFKHIGNCTVSFRTFNIEAYKPREFSVVDGDWQELKEYIGSLHYDGGTQIGALEMKDRECDEYLLFSDGMSNFGLKELDLPDRPVYVVNSSQIADHSYLNYIADATGGNYVNLSAIAASDAISIMSRQPLRLLSADCDGGSAGSLYPPAGSIVPSNGCFAGILNSSAATLTLNFGYGSTITRRETIDLDRGKYTVNSGIIPSIWAQKKLTELDKRYELNKEEITALGKEFSIVTRNTSLIVLETVSDYIRYGIEPPEELKAEFQSMKMNTPAPAFDDSASCLSACKTSYNRLLSWWSGEDEPKLILPKPQVQPQPQQQNGATTNTSLASQQVKLNTTLTYKGGIYCAIAGRVIDNNNQTLTGISVSVIGTGRGSYTDANGCYCITKILPATYDVKFSGLGFTEKRISVKADSGFTVELPDIKLDNYQIERVCVMARTDQSRKIGTITEECTNRSPVYSTGSTRSSGNSGTNRANPTPKREPGGSVFDVVGISSGIISTGPGWSIRGARSSETQIRPDGADIGNQFTGGFSNEYKDIPADMTRTSDRKSLPGDFSIAGQGNDAVQPTVGLSFTEFGFDADYIKLLAGSDNDEPEQNYLKMKEKYGNNPAFYLDACEFYMKEGNIEKAIVVLSNLAELKTENSSLLRTLGYRLYRHQHYKYAELIYREVLKIRGEEPQSYRDLALTCIETGLYQEAADLLYKIITTSWDSRFPGIADIALNDFNGLINSHRDMIDMKNYDPALIANIPVSIRIVLTWDSDNCDMDLWVTEPSGEKCFYGYKYTKAGGRISWDFTGGYGPEEYMMKNIVPGKYLIQANYYGTRQQSEWNPVNLKASVYLNYGTGRETRRDITFRLSERKEVVNIAELEFGVQ